ncbi:unnamed protein product, partial [Didymodactylos carnosus]
AVFNNDTFNATLYGNLSASVLIRSSYALSQACYRALIANHYDASLYACVIRQAIRTVNGTQYSTSTSRRRRKRTLVEFFFYGHADIYYKSRCVDSPRNFGINYTTSTNTTSYSSCRLQRMKAINSCFNKSSLILTSEPQALSINNTEVLIYNILGEIFTNYSKFTGGSSQPGARYERALTIASIDAAVNSQTRIANTTNPSTTALIG